MSTYTGIHVSKLATVNKERLFGLPNSITYRFGELYSLSINFLIELRFVGRRKTLIDWHMDGHGFQNRMFSIMLFDFEN